MIRYCQRDNFSDLTGFSIDVHGPLWYTYNSGSGRNTGRYERPRRIGQSGPLDFRPPQSAGYLAVPCAPPRF